VQGQRDDVGGEGGEQQHDQHPGGPEGSGDVGGGAVGVGVGNLSGRLCGVRRLRIWCGGGAQCHRDVDCQVHGVARGGCKYIAPEWRASRQIAIPQSKDVDNSGVSFGGLR
jgi:hypothetical protein